MAQYTEHGVTIDVTSQQGELTGTTQVEIVSDPGGDVAAVDFFVTDEHGLRSGPYDGDGGPSVFTHTVMLGRESTTMIEVEVVLRDGRRIVPPEPVIYGVRSGQSITGPVASVTSFNVSGTGEQTDVSVTLADAYAWRCWARRGAWPTPDASPTARPSDAYLIQDEQPDATSFLTHTPGAGSTWYLLARAYNVAGRPGPLASATREVI